MSTLPRLSILLAVSREQGIRATLIIGAVIGGIVIASSLLYLLARRLRRRMREESDAGDVLSGFRTLHYKGELSRDEYQRIRSSLAQQIRRGVTDNKKEA
jgi:hypothetical protein